ncbi:hypothetical protein RYX36_003844 [Vicia faba]
MHDPILLFSFILLFIIFISSLISLRKTLLKNSKPILTRNPKTPIPSKSSKKNVPTASQVTGPLQSSTAFVDPPYIYSTDSSSVLGTPVTSLPLSSWNYNAKPPASVPQLTTDDTGWTGSGQAAPLNCCNSSSNDNTHLALPSSKGINQGNVGKPVHVMPDFAQVYHFIGSVFDPNSINHLQRLKPMDPINVETTLLLMRNLSINPPRASPFNCHHHNRYSNRHH